MSLSCSPTPSITTDTIETTETSISPSVAPSVSPSITPSESSITTLANWECYECGFLNYDESSICQACFKKCLYCDDDSDAEDNEDCNSICKSSNRSSRSSILDIISFINNNSIKYEDSKRIIIHNVSESMANENLGNTRLFGVFGDVKKIEIIRNKRSNKIKAEITFYQADSVVALMKLSSSYHNYKIFNY